MVDRVIDVHIGKLRQKIEQNPAEPRFILTVRGFGYRFSGERRGGGVMKHRLLWKLLLINSVPVIGVIILVVWLAIDQLAAKYFMALMKRYEIDPTDIHQMFLASIHRYLIWACLAALLLAFVISYLLTRRLLRPLSQMSDISRLWRPATFRPGSR